MLVLTDFPITVIDLREIKLYTSTYYTCLHCNKLSGSLPNVTEESHGVGSPYDKKGGGEDAIYRHTKRR